MRKILLINCLAFLSLNTALAQCPTSNRDGIHVVQYGETLYRISKIYGVTIDNLRAWNGMQFNEILSVCQELKIFPSGTPMAYTQQVITTAPPATTETFVTRTVPSSTNTVVTTTATTVANKPFTNYQRQTGGRHVIAEGETIANLARLYGYTEERFREFNVLKSGQELTPGSVILSTDCSCNRVSYSNQSGSVFEGHWNQELIPHSEDAFYHKRYAGNNTTTHNTTTSNDYVNKFYTPPTHNTTSSGTVSTYRPAPAPYNAPTARVGRSSGGTSSIATNTNRSNINTIANVSFMSNEEQEMVKEINLIRSNPAGYIPYVQQYIQDIENGRAFGSSTVAAYELIDELKRTSRLSTLQPAQCLYEAAKQHGQETVRVGRSNHKGQDGSWPWDRVKRACSYMRDGNENLVGGPANVREAVMLLLVDDGISNRGHRKAILNKDWKYVACYKSGQVGEMPNNWVQLFGY